MSPQDDFRLISQQLNFAPYCPQTGVHTNNDSTYLNNITTKPNTTKSKYARGRQLKQPLEFLRTSTQMQRRAWKRTVNCLAGTGGYHGTLTGSKAEADAMQQSRHSLDCMRSAGDIV
jgi:hypothetical protein